MKHNKYLSKSRKATPWDDSDMRTASQEFIRSAYIEHYERNHKTLLESQEYQLINAFIPSHCPLCKSEEFTKFGFTKNRIQRYICKVCGKPFTVLNGTLFQDHKVPISEWIEFCLNLFHHVSISSDSRNNKNAMTTSRYWLQKLFLLLENYQDDIVLEGNVYFDETYYSVVRSDLILNPDGTKKRGISRNKICIAVGYDGTNVLCKVCGTGKPSIAKITKNFKGHIRKGSYLIHDGENSHDKMVQALELKSIVYKTAATKKLSDKENPLQPINHMHFLLKNFLNSHSGFDRDDLPGYLNVFCFIVNPPAADLEKIDILLNLLFQEEKTLRYRSLYAQK